MNDPLKILQADNERLRSELRDIKARLKREEGVLSGSSSLSADQRQASEEPGGVKVHSHQKLRWAGINHTLNKDQLERYSRQILLGIMGTEGNKDTFLLRMLCAMAI